MIKLQWIGIALLLNTSVFSQTTFWGMTYVGGNDNRGSIFSIEADGTNYTQEYEFLDTVGSILNVHGRTPIGDLVLNNDLLWGMTTSGGTINSNGTLFSFNYLTGEQSVRVAFDSTMGRKPQGNPLIINDVVYGLTRLGGSGGTSQDNGTIYSYDVNTEVFTVLYDFDNVQGAQPHGSLIEVNNIFYGTTRYGGSTGSGVIFSFDPSNSSYAVLHEFSGTDGNQPMGDLLEINNVLYGTTNTGGDSLEGVIFSYDLSTNFFQVEYHLDNNMTGGIPYGTLVHYNGELFGLASAGGTSSGGAIFKFNITNQTCVEMGGGIINTTGLFGPRGDLLISGNKMYGMCYSGGSNTVGGIFEYDLVANTISLFYEFSIAGSDGAQPQGSLIRIVDFTGIDEEFTNQFRIVPNPTEHQFYLRGFNSLTQQVVIWDAFSNKVDYDYSGNIFEINLLAKGFYFVQILDENQNTVSIEKLVIL